MKSFMRTPRFVTLFVMVLLALTIAGCNLAGGDATSETIDTTPSPAFTLPPTRTPQSTSGIPTPLPGVTVPAGQPTTVGSVPTAIRPPVQPQQPSPTPLPISIVILSPVPGNVIAGNVQVIGAAVHPNFLQYQIEFGPDPNPGNLWFPATGAVQTPVINGLLGIWNTTNINDGTYQVRLRVYLRDGTTLTTVVNNIRVQNRVPTPQPSATPNIPRPIAAFTLDRVSGQVPLTIRFTNQSSGQITSYQWNFGDSSSSTEINPVHTFNSPGLYTVMLTVTGPGGSSNVAQQINAQAPNAPNASFTANPSTGNAPLVVQFTNTSTGTINTYAWNFSDGNTSDQPNPVHSFTAAGTYNVFLTVTGPGGSSTVTQPITVVNPSIPTNTPVPPSLTPVPPTNTPEDTATAIVVVPTNTAVPPTATAEPPTLTPTTIPPTETPIPAPVSSFTYSADPNDPLTINFTSNSTGDISGYEWDFGDGATSTDANPTHTYASGGAYTVRLVAFGPGGSDESTQPAFVAQPVSAYFTWAADASNSLAINFTNQSAGDIDTYSWDFGDGTGSAETNPQHIYASGGSHTVNLSISGPGGATNYSETISVATPVSASFTFAVEPGNPLAVQFTSTSTGDITSYSWAFGDSTTSTDQNPLHTYAAGGGYPVTLTVQGPGGIDSFNTVVTVASPVNAAFTWAVDPNNLLAINFTNGSTGDIDTYLWDFGDGQTSTDANPQHIYASGGNYPVTLSVSGPGGANTFSETVSVATPASALFTYVVDANNTFTYQFTNASTGSITSYSWDFGDGQTSNAENPAHTFASAADYEVRLIVSGPGGSDSYGEVVSVQAPAVPPSALFTWADDPNNPLTIQFANSSTGDYDTFAWDFGDGNFTNEASPAHTYAAGGQYGVSLTVSNSANGESDSYSETIPVQEPVQPPNAFFTWAADPNNSVMIQFVDASSGDYDIISWDFGDGNVSAETNPVHTYAAGGQYPVTLTVTNSATAQSNTYSETIALQQPVVPPNALFTWAADPNNPLAIQFFNGSTGDYDTFAWDFGDGQTSAEANPVHTYAAGGQYPVSLTVTNSADAQTDTYSEPVSVQQPALPPVAAFTWAADPNNPLAIQFLDGSSGEYDTYAWDFGDGLTSAEANPAHTYAAAGQYPVTLTVTNSANALSNTYSETIALQQPVQPPNALFSALVNDPVNDPLTVQFTNDSTGDLVGYTWDFGDGLTSNDFAPTHTYADGGTYPVTLTVTGSDGTPASYSLDVTVQAPAQPPSALFTWAADPNTPLTIQFTNASSGDYDTFAWDFGDGNFSNESNPAHSYGGGGQYPVSLTVTNSANAQANTYSETITVEEAQQQPTIVDTTPVQPDVTSQELAPTVGNTINLGLQAGNRAYVFATAGDQYIRSQNVLGPFAPGGVSTIPDAAYQQTVDAFNTTDLGGFTSFNYGSGASFDSGTAANLLNPGSANPNCNAGETPLQCELRSLAPSIVLIDIGSADAANGTDVNTFRTQLQQIVDTAKAANVVPVLMTTPPRSDVSADRLLAINEQIIDVANANSVPVLNQWLLLTQLPNNGLSDGVNLSVSPNGAGDLSPSETSQYGANAVNEALLALLTDVRLNYLP